jgi:hypothetical protein
MSVVAAPGSGGTGPTGASASGWGNPAGAGASSGVTGMAATGAPALARPLSVLACGCNGSSRPGSFGDLARGFLGRLSAARSPGSPESGRV